MDAVPELIAEDFGGGKLKQQDALGNFANPDKIAMPDSWPRRLARNRPGYMLGTKSMDGRMS
ncbi:hypothetical protein B551_0224035 [Cupriavidus sp. HPC(L)]|nr:hypothetical protein B551_0224035 [Cupriavidus sp. HPC(L)]